MRKLTLLLCCLLAIGCSDEPEADLQGLKAKEGEWQAGFDARDAAAIASVYANNGAVLPPNGTAVRGRAAVQAFWSEFMTSGIGGDINDTEVYASGDLGYKTGNYVLTDPGGTTIDVGKYIEIWRHVDGQWQMTHDIFNSNMPIPLPPLLPKLDDEAEVVDDESELADAEG